MAASNRSLGLAALGWWLAARGLSEPIEESFYRLDPTGVQRLGKASRMAALVAARRLAEALRGAEHPPGPQPELFEGQPAQPSWLDRLETLLETPRIGLKLEKALIGDAEDFAALIEVELTEERSVMLAARLAGWIQSQIGGEGEPSAMAHFLAQGWPIASGSDRYVTFCQEFMANLLTELADAPREITIPLGEPSEFREWLEKESAGRLMKPMPEPLVESPAPEEDASDHAGEGGDPAMSVAGTPGEEWPSATHEESTVVSETPVAELAPAESHDIAPPPVHETKAEPAPEPGHPIVSAPSRGPSLGFFAFIFQLGWVALLLFGWHFLHERQVRMGMMAAASPAPLLAATPSPGGHPAASPVPASPAVAGHGATPSPTVAATAPSTVMPRKPEMSLLPDEMGTQAMELAAAGHHAEAVAVFRRIAQVQAQDRSTSRLPRALVYARMAASLAALERWDEADAVVERAQALLEELLPTQDPDTALGVEMVADYWASRERWPLAARLYQKAVQTYEGTKAENSAEEMSAINRLAGALRQIGEVKRSEQLYRQLVKGYEGAGSIVALDAASVAHNLANVLLTTNRAGEARTFYEKALDWLAKAPPESKEEAGRMAAIMSGNYERCLLAMGVSEEDARTKARKSVSTPVP